MNAGQDSLNNNMTRRRKTIVCTVTNAMWAGH